MKTPLLVLCLLVTFASSAAAHGTLRTTQDTTPSVVRLTAVGSGQGTSDGILLRFTFTNDFGEPRLFDNGTPVLLYSLKVYDGDGKVVFPNADPAVFDMHARSLDPGESLTLQATLSAFGYRLSPGSYAIKAVSINGGNVTNSVRVVVTR